MSADLKKSWYSFEPSKTDLDGFFMLDFFFSEEALAVMGQDLYDAPGDDMFEYDDKFSMNLKRVLGKDFLNTLFLIFYRYLFNYKQLRIYIFCWSSVIK